MLFMKKCLPVENLHVVVQEVLENYNKTRINIGHQHDRWMELKEVLRVQTHSEV
jgi:hypothetical protein